jgi:FHS family L-fucose permease-like MFS transporter
MGLPSHCLFRVPVGCSFLLVRHLLVHAFSIHQPLRMLTSSPIPEITDADMAFQAEETHANADIKPFRKQYRLFHAAFAQFCYTGAQVAIASYFINYVTETRPGTSSSLAAKFLAGAQGAFALGRFGGVGLMKYVRPRWVFLVYLTLCMVFIAPSITQRGNSGMAMLYITLFFESIIFPTIVALGMRGLGKYTKRGSGFIIAGVAGGACVPPLLGAVADLHNNTALAMVVPLCFFIAAWSYAITINFVPSYRDPADAFTVANLGLPELESGGRNGSAGAEKISVFQEREGIDAEKAVQ